jgi:hypothetical protein
MSARTAPRPRRTPRFPAAKRYALLSASVERGVQYASYRAWKHQSAPPTDTERARIVEVFHQAVMDCLCEDFEV